MIVDIYTKKLQWSPFTLQKFNMVRYQLVTYPTSKLNIKIDTYQVGKKEENKNLKSNLVPSYLETRVYTLFMSRGSTQSENDQANIIYFTLFWNNERPTQLHKKNVRKRCIIINNICGLIISYLLEKNEIKYEERYIPPDHMLSWFNCLVWNNK